jgi:hypothetical protein
MLDVERELQESRIIMVEVKSKATLALTAQVLNVLSESVTVSYFSYSYLK